VAIAAKYAQKVLGKQKICIFDWDVHCGDGTSNIFYEDDSVLYISLHRYDDGYFYPGAIGNPNLVGNKEGYGYNIQFGFHTRDERKNGVVGDIDYMYACETLLFPIIREFKPELILVSCGFDSAHGDPLG
jgi:acetoin utilization deacetylase AcuC-like enzyme